jgi:hypothetical protein
MKRVFLIAAIMAALVATPTAMTYPDDTGQGSFCMKFVYEPPYNGPPGTYCWNGSYWQGPY